jgi:cell division protein FtsB
MVLTYDAYNATIEETCDREKDVDNLKEQVAILKDAIRDMQQLLKNPDALLNIGRSQ